MGLARVLNSYESVRAFDKSIDWCIQFDSLGWDGSYFKIALELQAEYEQASRTYFHKLQLFKVMVNSISSRSWALLMWTDQRLQALSQQESVGPSVKVEEVKSPELARLLQQREAAYVAALMAILQWEAVQAAYLNADRKGARRYLDFKDMQGGSLEVFSCKHWSPCRSEESAKRWVHALMMVPGSDLCQELSSKLPAWVHKRSRHYPGDFYRSMAYHQQKSL